MTAFYSIQFTVITSKMRVNQMPRYYQANLLFHRNNTHLGHVFWYIHTVFIVLAFVKVQNINVFIHVFVKCVFFSLALNNEIAKILICKPCLVFRSSKCHCLCIGHIPSSLFIFVPSQYLVTGDLYVYFCDVKDRGWTIP